MSNKMEDLKHSLQQYNSQISMVNEALRTTEDVKERESLLSLQSDLNELLQLTRESLDTLTTNEHVPSSTTKDGNEPEQQTDSKNNLDDEYALFMHEMEKTGAYNDNPESNVEKPKDDIQDSSDDDIENELGTLLGMKCAVYHTHKWGGQPTLHNAMVSAVVPRQEDDQFKDLQVRVLFTHPTHAEMLPCPFFLDGDCRFNDEQCRYSHGAVVHLSDLKEAIEPNFDSIKTGSRVLLKVKPPDNEDISLAKKTTEKYHLWHRALVKTVDLEKRVCVVKLEQGMKTGEKRKSGTDVFQVRFEDVFPLESGETDDEDSLSDTEYPESKTICTGVNNTDHALLVEKSLHNNAPAMGEWERHTRGIGSKLMLAMGYVPGTGLGSGGEGRLQPVEARVLPVGKSLDHCMAISEKAAGQDPLKIEQKLKRLQKKEEERNKRAYEREKEKERRNVFNFLNRTLGDNSDDTVVSTVAAPLNVKQSSSKDLNIEQFKITEDSKKIEREIVKLNSSIAKYPMESNGYRSIAAQIAEKNKELELLKKREQQIAKEQKHRKDKQKMTIF